MADSNVGDLPSSPQTITDILSTVTTGFSSVFSNSTWTIVPSTPTSITDVGEPDSSNTCQEEMMDVRNETKKLVAVWSIESVNLLTRDPDSS